MTHFDPAVFLPAALVDQVTDLRVKQPGLVASLAQQRRRRSTLAPDGKLVIIAADHPARHVLRAGAYPQAMANRGHYLARMVRVLQSLEVDGIMASPDILDELFLLNHLVTTAGGNDFLAEKVLIGCLNRGGLAGAAWELDDFVTGHTPAGAAQLGLDGVKMLLRLNLADEASRHTLRYCAEAVMELAALGLPAFVEPLPVERNAAGQWAVTKTADALLPLLGVTSALGDTSAWTWLKLPMTPDFARVAAATTCPILLLGGESTGDPAAVLHEIEACMAAGGTVRGLMIGRSVLYPAPGEDPYAVAVASSRIVRGTWTAAEAVAGLPELRQPVEPLVEGAVAGSSQTGRRG